MTVLAVVTVLIILVVGLALYAKFVETRRFRIVRIRMHTRREMEGKLDILHISDMHFQQGDDAKLEFLRTLHSTPVDMVFVTGDMIEDDSGIDYCVEALRGFRPRIGIFAVFGAHDHWESGLWNVILDLSLGGYHQGTPNDFERLKRELGGIGTILLENNSRHVVLRDASNAGLTGGTELWMVGVDDVFVGLEDFEKALAGVPADAFKILLTHAIEDPGELAARGFDAVFAGHSHGGQVRIPFLGAVITRSSLHRQYASGAFEIDGTVFHLNNGIGGGRWTDFRFLCPPEATHVELTGQRPARASRA